MCLVAVYIGLTNAKINDAQSGFETGMSTLAGLLAGADMLNMGGLLDALTAFDFAKAIIDDEIAQMLKRIKRGFEFTEGNMALDVIREISPGGTFMMHNHTVEWMRKTALLPKIAERDTLALWEQTGSLDAQARAMDVLRNILGRQNQAAFSPEVEAGIRSEFPEMVPGNSKLPEGW